MLINRRKWDGNLGNITAILRAFLGDGATKIFRVVSWADRQTIAGLMTCCSEVGVEASRSRILLGPSIDF